MRAPLTTALCLDWAARRHGRNRFTTACLPCLALFVSILLTYRGLPAQTVFGQQGTLLTPSADTWELGGFLVGAHYRGFSYGDHTYEVIPLELLMGLGPRLDLGFSFPGIGGNRATPDFTDDVSQLSLKARLLGENGDPWRAAVACLFQREVGPPGQDEGRFQSLTGLQVIASHRRDEWDWHGAASASFRSDGTGRRYVLGLGADRPLAKGLMFRGDLAAAWSGRTPALQALAGLTTEVFPNLELTLGGGVGLGRDDFDWQGLAGLTLTSTHRESASRKKTDALLAPPDLTLLEEIAPIGGGTGGAADGDKGGGTGGPHLEAPGEGQGGWKGELELSQRLFFDFASAELNEFELPALVSAIETIGDMGSGIHFQVIGNTDSYGDSRINLFWGLTRSLSIAHELHSRSTIAVDRLLILSCGKEELADTRAAPGSSQLNRRVVLRTWTAFPETRRHALDGNQAMDLQRVSPQAGDSLVFRTGLITPRERIRLFESLDALGVKGNSRLMLEALRPQGAEPLQGFRKLALLWMSLMSQTEVDPTRIFLHIQTGTQALARAPDASTAAQPAMDIQFGALDYQGRRLRVPFTLGQQAGLERHFAGRIVAVVDVGSSRFTHYGQVLDATRIPDGLRGAEIRLDPLATATLHIPVPSKPGPRARVSLFIYDREGRFLQRVPWYDAGREAYWDDRVVRALGIATRESLDALPVMVLRLEPPIR